MDAASLATGPSYWQVGAALVAVLALLVVVLKFLQRWQGAGAPGGDARLLSVRRLGPRRELQVLQVGDRVHTIYRHDSAMVLLGTEARSTHETARPAATVAPAPLHRRLLALVASSGGASRTVRP